MELRLNISSTSLAYFALSSDILPSRLPQAFSRLPTNPNLNVPPPISIYQSSGHLVPQFAQNLPAPTRFAPQLVQKLFLGGGGSPPPVAAAIATALKASGVMEGGGPGPAFGGGMAAG